MDDSKFADVFNSRDNLLEKATRRWLVHFLILDDVVK